MHESPLPTEQAAHEGLPALSPRELHRRREAVFLILAGLFLGTLAMLNIIGITRFLDLSIPVGGDREIPLVVAVGVLPYPVTFLCTDFICELFGRRRANQVVFVGFALNLWVILILTLGANLPGFASPTYDGVYLAAKGAVAASMFAYLAAQLVDVRLFHFWKRVTHGRHLWLRNNGSTLVSQLVDTTAVILITHYATGALEIRPDASLAAQLAVYIASGYAFKVVAALLDTGPFYLGTALLTRYLRLPRPGVRGAESPGAGAAAKL